MSFVRSLLSFARAAQVADLQEALAMLEHAREDLRTFSVLSDAIQFRAAGL